MLCSAGSEAEISKTASTNRLGITKSMFHIAFTPEGISGITR